MIEVEEILYHWSQGSGVKKMARSCGVSRYVVRRLIQKAEAFGLKPGDPFESIHAMACHIQETRSQKNRSGHWSQQLQLYHEELEEWRTLPYITVRQMVRLLQERGEAVSESSLHRYLKKHFPVAPKSTVHLLTTPGAQAQVDFGFVGLLIDPACGKKRKSYAFVMILSHSRHRFVRFVFSQDVATWIDCHIRAFFFFGGVPWSILIDNLKSGVCKPHLYDPIINRAYSELERHCGFVVDTAKIRTPTHKGKVERSILVVKQQLIAGRTYADITAANEAALKWCREDIAHLVVRTTGRTPWDCFTYEEKPALKPLPPTPFECPLWQEGLVHRDQHVVFCGSFYSVPFAYLGKKLMIRGTIKVVKIFDDLQLIKTHVRASTKGQWVTDQQDYPKSANYFLKADKASCLSKAQAVGNATSQVIETILASPSLTCLRKAQAILRLAERHSAQRLEAACKRALRYEAFEYIALKRILTQGLEQEVCTLDLTRVVPSLSGAYLRSPFEFTA